MAISRDFMEGFRDKRAISREISVFTIMHPFENLIAKIESSV